MKNEHKRDMGSQGIWGQVFPYHITYSVLLSREDVAWKDLTLLCSNEGKKSA